MTTTMTTRDRRQATRERVHEAKRNAKTIAYKTHTTPAVVVKKRTRPAPAALYALIFSAACLSCLGLVAVLSATSTSLVDNGLSPWGMFLRQCGWIGAGVVLLLIASRISPKNLSKLAPFIFGAGLLALLLPFVPGIGFAYQGARAWIKVGGQTFQTSEVAKLALLVYVSSVIANNYHNWFRDRSSLLRIFGSIGVVVGVMAAQQDLGGACVVGGTAVLLLFLAGLSLRMLAVVTIGGAAAIGALVFSSARRYARWTAFLHLDETKQTTGYQVWQSLVGLGEGGPWGRGAGAGLSKWGFLPLPHSDFVFSVVGEELGFIGAVAVLLCFATLLFSGFHLAAIAKDPFEKVLGLGISSWFCLQGLINLGGVTGLLPVTGLTLPFVSFGGSSAISCLAGLGLVVGIGRRSHR